MKRNTVNLFVKFMRLHFHLPSFFVPFKTRSVEDEQKKKNKKEESTSAMKELEHKYS